MATFAKPTYTTTAYSLFRPTYPPHLFTRLLQYHSPTPTTTHLDLGTGPGTILPYLSPPFTLTHAVDPSPPMLTLAQKLLPPHLKPTTTFHLSRAESLPFLPPNSISLITAAQSAHWFALPDIWGELARVALRPGGTVAFWGYKDCLLTSYPRASLILSKYAYGKDEEDHWGRYWSQPGRSRVQERLRALRPPDDGRWAEVRRWEYEPEFTPEAATRTGLRRLETVSPETPEEAEAAGPGIFGELVYPNECMLKKEMAIWEIEEYIRTWSAVHAWKEAHPDRVRKKEEGDGDSVDECFEEMARVEGWREGWREMRVMVEWGHGMLFCKRTEKK